ncbi:RodZ domain-containing protein [Deinococcus sp.]|uniref:RodZ domain-containing protein n=1 Tax=Deinococcus sp. TaxID=47478 RepID=UPI0025BAC809|nr:RodZ domain-containing protein [Deinococcus sp.]
MTFGKVLKDARTAQGLTLAQLSAATRIRRDYLAALEDENFAALPERTFSRSFLQQYARELRLDPAPLLARFDEKLPYTTMVNYGQPDVSKRRAAPVRPAQPGHMLLPLLLGGLLLLIGGGYLATRNHTQETKTAAAAPPPVPTNVNLSVKSTPSGARVYLDNRDLGYTPVQSFPVGSRKGAALRVEYRGRMPFKQNIDLRTPRDLRVRLLPIGEGPSIMTDVATGQAQESLPVTLPQEPIKGVHLTFSADSWVRATARDGEVLYEGVVPSGASKTFSAGVTIRAGNAGAVHVSVDGGPERTMGPAGQVATQTF